MRDPVKVTKRRLPLMSYWGFARSTFLSKKTQVEPATVPIWKVRVTGVPAYAFCFNVARIVESSSYIDQSVVTFRSPASGANP